MSREARTGSIPVTGTKETLSLVPNPPTLRLFSIFNFKRKYFLCSTGVQRLARQPSKLNVRVRIPCVAPLAGYSDSLFLSSFLNSPPYFYCLGR